MEVIELDWWSNFCGDAMVMVFFWKRCDTDVFGNTLPLLLMRLFGPNHLSLCYGCTQFLVGFHGCPRCFHGFSGLWLVFLGFSTVGAWVAMYRSSPLVIDRKNTAAGGKYSSALCCSITQTACQSNPRWNLEREASLLDVELRRDEMNVTHASHDSYCKRAWTWKI